MNLNNFEQQARHVADLAEKGQGCAIWDELSNLTSREAIDLLTKAKSFTANPTPGEMRSLPGVDIRVNNSMVPVKIDMLDKRGKVETRVLAMETESSFSELIGNPKGNFSHDCKNIGK